MVTQKIEDLPVITCEYVSVTVDMAYDFLHRTAIQNRDITQATVHKYARKIIDNRWKVTGETLKFDKDGNLLDGQHRLWGFIETGLESAVFLCMYNIPPESQRFMDNPKVRTSANTLEMEGYLNARTVSATSRMLNEWEQGIMPGSNQWRVALDNDQTLTYAQANPDVTVSVEAVLGTPGLKALGKPATIAFAHTVTHRLNPTIAKDFWKRRANAEYDSPSDPVMRIREKLIVAKSQPHHLHSKTAIAAYIFKAWNATVRGRPIGNINWTQRGDKMEKFPEPISTARRGRPRKNETDSEE